MAAPMRSTSSQQEAGHRARVADLRQQGPLHSSPCITSSSNSTSSSTSTLQQHHHQVIQQQQHQQQPPTSQSSSSSNHHHHNHHHHHHHQGLSVTASTTTNNFEYDDNEWDIGIGDLIIDLDADIEKTNEGNNNNNSINSNSSGGGLAPSSVTGVGGNLVPGTTTLCGDQQHHQVNALQATTVMATSANPNTSTKNAAKMAIEHSATVDKGLKMKIKRTKPGTKSSEAKHEIVKSNEQNGTTDATDIITGGGGGGKGTSGTSGNTTTSGKHPSPNSINTSGGISSLSNSSSSNSQNSNSSSSSSSANSTSGSGSGNKRSSGGHRRDKARDKHSEKQQQQVAAAQQLQTSAQQNSNTNSSGGNSNNSSGGNAQSNSNNNNSKVSGNNNSNNGNSGNNGGSGANNVQVVDGGLVRVSVGQVGGQRPVFPASTGPGPPNNQQQQIGGIVIGGPPPSPAAATAQGSASKPEQAKVGIGGGSARQPTPPTGDDRSSSPPPSKKLKTEIKETVDVCVGTSVGTITEPDCLGPCEPGTSVTLEGIVWHETEGGVLVVNVTWRGKTYVGTLLDCTRHDWAPPRFCDSPTSDLDTRTPKGRGKRGRSAAATTAAAAAAAAATANTPNTDQTNNNYFTETRSSAHSKLRNGGGATGPGAPKGRRGAAANGANPSATAATATAPSSPTPFAPPRVEPTNKRKSRSGEEDGVPAGGKKSKTAANATVSTLSSNSSSSSTTSCNSSSTALNSSPPPSPVLLECPEPNCSKKYKHINGLKYHQSHAHGSADDEDTKDVTSMSENDESSNIEAPSPATPVKSPDKSQDSPATPQKKEDLPLILRSLDATSQPDTPRSTPPSPATPQSIQDMTNSVGSPSVPLAEAASNGVAKSVVAKASVLRYTEEFPVSNIFPGNKNQSVSGNNLTTPSPLATVRPVNVSSISSELQQVQQHPQEVPCPQQQPQQQLPPPQQQQTFGGQLQQQQQMPSQTFTQPPTLMIPSQNQPQIQSLPSPHPPQSPKTTPTNLTQFKVKPTSALMPEDKKTVKQPLPPNFNKKKSRKSPASSPDPPQANEAPVFGMENQSGRDEVQSPAYSDISDDGAPVIESDDKSKGNDKKTDSGQQMQHMPSYVYPFYGQAPYLVSSVQENKNKEPEKQQQTMEKQPIEKDNLKKDNTNNPEYQQKVLQQHYYPYGYMPSYPYNMETSYVPSINDDKIKEERGKDNPSPLDQQQNVKQNAPIPNPIQVPNPGKVKTEPNVKDKHQNDNHQILKESIEMKNQMSYNVYSRQQVHAAQREDDVRRFYAYQEQRRKEQQHQHQQQQQAQQQAQQQQQQQQNEKNLSQNKVPSQSPNLKHKEKPDDKKEKDVKQEGVKPTMETQGPPPPPTSQYYIHPSYMQSPHYGPLPFDPNHVYRGIMVPGPYGSNPYLHHPQLSRYAPEDLSRPPPPTKALDMLQHHAQYYSPHKIHELQERAIKSPTPKTSVASSSPSANSATVNSQQMSGVQQQQVVSSSQASAVASSGSKQVTGDGKESRSPPPQRHVHTHHHTHVGLGYPMYPAPYGAAVLASQQAAAVTVINPYPPK